MYKRQPLKKLKNSGTIVALDGGANKLIKLGFKPHIILGDLDSIKKNSSTKDQLKEYKQLFDEGLISEEEYKALKKKALNL